MSFARRSTNARQIPVKTEPRVSIVSIRSNVFVPMDTLGPGAKCPLIIVLDNLRATSV